MFLKLLKSVYSVLPKFLGSLIVKLTIVFYNFLFWSNIFLEEIFKVFYSLDS